MPVARHLWFVKCSMCETKSKIALIQSTTRNKPPWWELATIDGLDDVDDALSGDWSTESKPSRRSISAAERQQKLKNVRRKKLKKWKAEIWISALAPASKNVIKRDVSGIEKRHAAMPLNAFLSTWYRTNLPVIWIHKIYFLKFFYHIETKTYRPLDAASEKNEGAVLRYNMIIYFSARYWYNIWNCKFLNMHHEIVTILRYWQTRTHCCGHIVKMFPCARKLGNICCGHKMFLNKIRKIFVSRTQNLCPQQMLRARANGETFVADTRCF